MASDFERLVFDYLISIGNLKKNDTQSELIELLLKNVSQRSAIKDKEYINASFKSIEEQMLVTTLNNLLNNK